MFPKPSPAARRLPRKARRLAVLLCCAGAAAQGWGLHGPPRHPDPQGSTQGDPFGARLPRPGYLGVSLRDLDAAEATRFRMPAILPGAPHPTMGALIVTVDRDAPAWAAGLRPGDIVLELNGLGVEGVEDLRKRLREFAPGITIMLRTMRAGEERSVAVVLGDQDAVAQNAFNRHLHAQPEGIFSSGFGMPTGGAPASAALLPAPKSRGVASTLFDALTPGSSSYTGLEVNPLTPQLAAFFGVRADGGLLVTAVNDNSPAAFAGLSAGDVILRAAGKPVASRSALAHALHGGKGRPVPLTVLHDHQEVLCALQPGRRKK